MEKILDLVPYIKVNDYKARLNEVKKHIKCLQIDENDNLFHARLFKENILNRPEKFQELIKKEKGKGKNTKFYTDNLFEESDLTEFKLWSIYDSVKYPMNPLYYNGSESIQVTKKGKEYVAGGWGVYILSNMGGHKKTEINGWRSFYVDVDFGKENLIYPTLEAVEKAKETYLSMEDNDFATIKPNFIKVEGKEILSSYSLTVYKTDKCINRRKRAYLNKHWEYIQHALIIETFNGFHIYFLMNGEVYLDKNGNKDTKFFGALHEELINKFEGDTAVKDENRVLRLAGYIHSKRTPFVVRIVHIPKRRFSIKEFLEFLKIDEEELVRKNSGSTNRVTKTVVKENKNGTVTLDEKRQTQRQKADSTLYFKQKTDYERTRMSMSEFKQWVLEQPLNAFFEDLPNSGHFHCHFHNDSNPSATAFQTDTGIYLYSCFGCSTITNVPVSKHIITLAQQLKGLTFYEALKFLARLANVTIELTDFEIDQKYNHEAIQSFKHGLVNMIKNGEIHTDLAYYLQSFTRMVVYDKLLEASMSSVLKSEFRYKEKNTFFCSIRHMAESTMNEKYIKYPVILWKEIIVLQLLGFVERVPNEQLNIELLERAKKIKEINYDRKVKKANKIKHTEYKEGKDTKLWVTEEETSFYILHNPFDVLEKAEKMAVLMRQKNFSTSHDIHKKNLISLFGDEVANKVFPNSEVTLSEEEADIKKKIEKKIIKVIEKQGYCLQNDVLNPRLYKVQGKHPSKTKLETVYKRFVRKGLTKAQIKTNNQENREKYGYKIKGKQDLWVLNE